MTKLRLSVDVGRQRTQTASIFLLLSWKCSRQRVAALVDDNAARRVSKRGEWSGEKMRSNDSSKNAAFHVSTIRRAISPASGIRASLF